MSEAGLLNLVLFLPLIGIGLLLVAPNDKPDFTRGLTLIVMVQRLLKKLMPG